MARRWIEGWSHVARTRGVDYDHGPGLKHFLDKHPGPIPFVSKSSLVDQMNTAAREPDVCSGCVGTPPTHFEAVNECATISCNSEF